MYDSTLSCKLAVCGKVKRQVLVGNKTQCARRPDMANLKFPGGHESERKKKKQKQKHRNNMIKTRYSSTLGN